MKRVENGDAENKKNPGIQAISVHRWNACSRYNFRKRLWRPPAKVFANEESI